MNSYEVPRLFLLLIFAMTVRESIQKVCFGGQIWAVCGKTCTPSCDDPKPGPSCDDPCVPRCKCPREKPIMYHGTCIIPQACTAKYCRGKRFHPYRQMCCKGVVTNRPKVYPGCCGNRSYQMAIEECVGGQVERLGSRKTGCIGGTEWTNCSRECSPTCDDPEPFCRTDCVKRCHCPPRKPIFYQGQCITASDCPVKKCKNGQTFSPKTEMCCSGIVSPRPELYPMCCHKTPFSRLTHKCVNDRTIAPLNSTDIRPDVSQQPTQGQGQGSVGQSQGQGSDDQSQEQDSGGQSQGQGSDGQSQEQGNGGQSQGQDQGQGSGGQSHTQFPRCSNRPYNVNVQICCGGDINRKPRVQPACCEKTAYSKQTHKCVNGNVEDKSQQSHGHGSGSGTQFPRCGGRPYNVNVQICCGGEINRKPRAQPACCEKAAYSKQTHKCVNGNVERKSQQSDGQGGGLGIQYPRCGGRQYNVNVQICCRGDIKRKPRVQPDCCEKAAYSKQTHKCVNGNVERKSQQSNGPSGGSGTKNRRCRGRRYNVNVQICCGGKLRRKPKKWPSCCRTSAYSKKTHECVRGYVKWKVSGRGQTRECGGRPYDPNTRMCCSNIINPKPARQPRCCFDVSFSRATHMCRNSRVVRR